MTQFLTNHYLSRAERADFVATNFAPALAGKTLDVGCGEAYLRDHLSHYVGIDIVRTSDILVDLEQGGLPFCSQSFDTALCIDVLEHLESLPTMFQELFRVARQNVIISLPNQYALGWRLKFLRGEVLSKEYSLFPRNRHKWLPSFLEIQTFMRTQVPDNWQIQAEYGYDPPSWWRTGPLYKAMARRYPNLFATTYWVVFEQCL